MRKLTDVCFSMLTSVILLVIFGVSIACATFVENNHGTEYARELIYNARWFEVLLVLIVFNLVGRAFRNKLVNNRKWTILIIHLAFIFILIGSAVTRYFGFEGMIHIRQGETRDDISIPNSELPHKLPFSITLVRFELDRYPRSNSPSSFASEITVTDNEKKSVRSFRIYMNNILKYRGYRFFQSSYDQDEKGTFLSVSYDFWGTAVTYAGYFLMVIGMILTLFNKTSRFRQVLRLSDDMRLKRKAVIMIALLFAISNIAASEVESSKKEHLKELNSLLILDKAQGRVEPFSTFASDVLRKISRKNSYNKMSATEVIMAMSANTLIWQNEPIIKVSNRRLGDELGAINGYVSYNQLFNNGGTYRLAELVEQVYQKELSARNKYDKELLNVDERVNICYQLYSGSLLQFISEKGGTNIPSARKIKAEIFYNDLNLFGKLAKLYALLGFFLLVLNLVYIFSNSGLGKVFNFAFYVFGAIFVVYTAGLVLRWYISNHAPWSNGYETMVFVGWATSLSGLLFARKSPITLAITSVLAGIVLFVAGMSWMNPEITNLVPVLKSYWLIFHVAIITSSYGFLAMGALLGFLNMTLLAARIKNKSERLNNSIQEISYITELALYVGLILLTLGCILGAVWANESWGRYWGWDPKETWALISIIVYAIILHLIKIPKVYSPLLLSILAFLGFSAIIMTFFGVNYYFTGMHSYAQ